MRGPGFPQLIQVSCYAIGADVRIMAVSIRCERTLKGLRSEM
jgi:hypothetical protein